MVEQEKGLLVCKHGEEKWQETVICPKLHGKMVELEWAGNRHLRPL